MNDDNQFKIGFNCLFEGLMKMIFYQLYKRRGCQETLYALYSCKNHNCSLPEFFEKLKQEEHSYYNAFFRVKEDLLKLGLIEYRKNRYKEKVIQLTCKGIKIVKILKEIEILMAMDSGIRNEQTMHSHKEEHMKPLITP
jgi:hypothetical protein